MSSNHNTPLKVGGVPEHFNIPWQLAQAEQSAAQPLFTFVEQKCGTGEMIQNLKNGSLDVIVALTEGLVADIARGSDLRLLGTYVESPLCWAVSAGADAPYSSIEDLKGQTFGISRLQSGSHLMAFVLGLQRGWDVRGESANADLKFAVKGNFEQLRQSVNDGSTAAFMWETFMTKPYVDRAEVRKVGEVVTPWPCFMMAARAATIDARLADIQALQRSIQTACARFAAEPLAMQARIVEQFHLTPADAAAWYASAVITGSAAVSEAALERTISTLIDAGVLAADVNSTDLELYLDTRVCRLERNIHSMKLYSKPELVVALFADLRAAGLARGALTYEQLLPFDQHHYGGTADVDFAFQHTLGGGGGGANAAAAVGASGRAKVVMNIGSGLGGPARYLAGRYGCEVVALELQEELSHTASELTARCKLDRSVTHLNGDFMAVGRHLQAGGFDAIVSWLTVLHFTDRHSFFGACARLLRSSSSGAEPATAAATRGGRLYAADFFAKRRLSKEERRVLASDVWCRYLPDAETYRTDITQAGLEIVEVRFSACGIHLFVDLACFSTF